MKIVVETDRDYALFLESQTQSLLTTAYLLTHDRLAAEELVQDTMVALYVVWEKVMQADAPLAYVRRSLVNRYLNQRRRPISQVEYVEEIQDNVVFIDFAETIANQDVIRRGLSRLPARQRAAIVLRYFHDVSDEQGADILRCRAGTFRSLLSRGITSMRLDLSSSNRSDAAGKGRT